jgi:hypothetical protein
VAESKERNESIPGLLKCLKIPYLNRRRILDSFRAVSPSASSPICFIYGVYEKYIIYSFI